MSGMRSLPKCRWHFWEEASRAGLTNLLRFWLVPGATGVIHTSEITPLCFFKLDGELFFLPFERNCFALNPFRKNVYRHGQGCSRLGWSFLAVDLLAVGTRLGLLVWVLAWLPQMCAGLGDRSALCVKICVSFVPWFVSCVSREGVRMAYVCPSRQITNQKQSILDVVFFLSWPQKSGPALHPLGVCPQNESEPPGLPIW